MSASTPGKCPVKHLPPSYISDDMLYQLTNDKYGTYSPAISPDGKRIVYSSFRVDGHEIHEVVVCMGETQFSFNRHLTSDNTVSKHQGVSIHRMNETEITIFDKVSKQYKKLC